jgi:peptide methionine sulfoxide reductase msrA/msrB
MNPMHPIISITLFTTAAAAVIGLGLAAAPNLTPPGRDASTMTISETDRRISASGHDVTPLSRDEVERLASKLTPEQYRITQKAGTERAFCGTLLDNKKEGMYVCVVCGLPLFKSEHKFTSGTGWPSFFTPFDADHVTEKTDETFGMVRVEIECARCGSHLGHVFPDGPPPTGQRYCLNSEALAFVEKGEEVPVESRPLALETGYFAGGCFWGVEHGFQQIPGVISVESGYQQGRIDNPTYRQICTGDTGHAESVKVVFDPRKVSYEKLVRFFLFLHDPTQLNRQGPDFGTQYRSGIYTVGPRATGGRVQREGRTRHRRPLQRTEDRHRDRTDEDVLARRGLSPGLHHQDRPLVPCRSARRVQGRGHPAARKPQQVEVTPQAS